MSKNFALKIITITVLCFSYKRYLAYEFCSAFIKSRLELENLLFFENIFASNLKRSWDKVTALLFSIYVFGCVLILAVKG